MRWRCLDPSPESPFPPPLSTSAAIAHDRDSICVYPKLVGMLDEPFDGADPVFRGRCAGVFRRQTIVDQQHRNVGFLDVVPDNAIVVIDLAADPSSSVEVHHRRSVGSFILGGGVPTQLDQGAIGSPHQVGTGFNPGRGWAGNVGQAGVDYLSQPQRVAPFGELGFGCLGRCCRREERQYFRIEPIHC